MVTKEQLARINELAKLAKQRDLTKEEKSEQTKLREKYLEGVRNSLKNQMKSLKIVDEKSDKIVNKEQIARINEIDKLAKQRDLTKEEKSEQTKLREKYLEGVRNSLKNQMKSLKIVDEKGADITPEKVKNLKKDNH